MQCGASRSAKENMLLHQLLHKIKDLLDFQKPNRSMLLLFVQLNSLAEECDARGDAIKNYSRAHKKSRSIILLSH
jgi:hypothetical protein